MSPGEQFNQMTILEQWGKEINGQPKEKDVQVQRSLFYFLASINSLSSATNIILIEVLEIRISNLCHQHK